uniref:Ccr_16 putative toxin n=1 Tax=Crassispira cerithina TaxID=1077925 RepID=A0A098LXV6_CRACE
MTSLRTRETVKDVQSYFFFSCSFFFSASALASSASCALIRASTWLSGRIVITVLPSFRVSVAISTLSGVSLVRSRVLLSTLTDRASASSRLVSPSLYSCFSRDTALALLLPMHVAFHPP